MSEDQIDEIVKDVSEMFHSRRIPMLLVYVTGTAEEGISSIRTRQTASTLDLISLVSSSVMILSEALSVTMNIDRDLALELAIDSIKDCLKSTKTKPQDVV